jgi:hypothetical protein
MTSAVTTLKSGAVFMGRVMACVAYMALTIPGLVPMKMVERLLPALRPRPYVTVMRIVSVIDVAVEAVMAMKPGAGSDEHPAGEPIRPIVTIRSTVIGSIVEVPIRAYWRCSDVDRNLSRSRGHTARQHNNDSRKSEPLPSGHNFSPRSFS